MDYFHAPDGSPLPCRWMKQGCKFQPVFKFGRGSTFSRPSLVRMTHNNHSLSSLSRTSMGRPWNTSRIRLWFGKVSCKINKSVNHEVLPDRAYRYGSLVSEVLPVATLQLEEPAQIDQSPFKPPSFDATPSESDLQIRITRSRIPSTAQTLWYCDTVCPSFFIEPLRDADFSVSCPPPPCLQFMGATGTGKSHVSRNSLRRSLPYLL